MLVKRAEMFPVECVARGYLAGSGWKEYRATGNSVRNTAARRFAGWIAAAGADFYAGDQERRMARTTRTFRFAETEK